METWLITGGAGFIGCNFVRLVLLETNARVVILDKLTYAGSLDNLGEALADLGEFESARAAIAESTRAAATESDDVLAAHASLTGLLVDGSAISSGRSPRAARR